jgi:hypothetical protein
MEKQAENTNIIVFSLTCLGLECIIYHTQDEHVNHYTAEADKRFTCI